MRLQNLQFIKTSRPEGDLSVPESNRGIGGERSRNPNAQELFNNNSVLRIFGLNCLLKTCSFTPKFVLNIDEEKSIG